MHKVQSINKEFFILLFLFIDEDIKHNNKRRQLTINILFKESRKMEKTIIIYSNLLTNKSYLSLIAFKSGRYHFLRYFIYFIQSFNPIYYLVYIN
jgi:hypothetical protein